jgi:MFS family permease
LDFLKEVVREIRRDNLEKYPRTNWLKSCTVQSYVKRVIVFQVFYYSTNLFITTGLSESHAKFATIGIGTVMVVMTLISIPLMDRSGRRTLHLYGLGGMFIFSIFITISFLVKVRSVMNKCMTMPCIRPSFEGPLNLCH